MTRSFLLVLLALIAALTASAADSAQDMLAAGRVDEAIAELNGQLSSAPADAESSNLLCRAYYALEDWDRAESSCKKAASLDPDNSRFHLWLGRVYGEKADRANSSSRRGSGRKGSRRIRARRATGSERHGCPARSGGVLVLARPGSSAAASTRPASKRRSIATVDPGREHWIYARIAEKKKDAATAEREYRQYIDLSKGDGGSLAQPGVFSPPPEALSTKWSKPSSSSAKRPSPNPILWLKRPRYCIAPVVAILSPSELLRRYLAAGPVEEAPAFRAHYLLGLLLEKQGDKAGAAQEYRASLSLARNFGYGPASTQPGCPLRMARFPLRLSAVSDNFHQATVPLRLWRTTICASRPQPRPDPCRDEIAGDEMKLRLPRWLRRTHLLALFTAATDNRNAAARLNLCLSSAPFGSRSRTVRLRRLRMPTCSGPSPPTGNSATATCRS